MTLFSRMAGLVAVAVATVSAPALAQTTTVTSPSGLFTNPTPVNATGPGAAYDTWYANNVRNNGAVGITTTYARSGNGSIEFRAPQGGALSSKADLEYYFSPANQFLLSNLTSFSYDFLRDSASSLDGALHPSLRLYVSDGAGHSGYLVYEGAYNGVPVAPTDAWTHVDIVGGAGDKYIWSTGTLPDAFSNYTRTAADWASLLPDLTVLGFSTGVGSGWNGSFSGAVDNVAYRVGGGPLRTFNFEAVAGSAVPEPATWVMLSIGFGAIGFALRRRIRRSNEAFEAKLKQLAAGIADA